MFGKTPSFSLANFEGPLELLLYLIQKDEMDILEIAIKELTSQLSNNLNTEPAVDSGADALVLTATLLLIKSQKLLPKISEIEENQEEDPRLEMIQQLLEFSRFKETANALVSREESQKVFFPRNAPNFEKNQPECLEEIELQDLTLLFNEIVKRAEKNPKHVIKEEEWQVSTKINWLRKFLENENLIAFTTFISEEMGQDELIVSFLAVLELMKLGEIKIVRDESMIYITKVQRNEAY